MNRIKKILIATVGTVALAAAATVMAAPDEGKGGCGMGGMGGGMGMMHHQGMKGGMKGGGGDMTAMVTQRLAQFKTDLKITAAQEAAWTAFSTQATEQAKSMQAMHAQHDQGAKDGKGTQLSAPDRMGQQLAHLKARMAGMETMQATVKDLYATLTPEQRTVADQHFQRMHGGGRGHGPKHGEHKHG